MSQQTPLNIQGLILSQKLCVVRLHDAGLSAEEIFQQLTSQQL